MFYPHDGMETLSVDIDFPLITQLEDDAKSLYFVQSWLHHLSSNKYVIFTSTNPIIRLYFELINTAYLKFHIEPEGTTSLGRKKKLINNSGIPQHEIEHIARCILPDILAYYESEEGQREFQELLAQREVEQTEGKEGKSR